MFREQLFANLINTIEAKQCTQVILSEKFDRLDTEFLNRANIYQYLREYTGSGQDEPDISFDALLASRDSMPRFSQAPSSRKNAWHENPEPTSGSSTSSIKADLNSSRLED